MVRGLRLMVWFPALFRSHEHHRCVYGLARDAPVEQLFALRCILDFQHLYVLPVVWGCSDRYVPAAHLQPLSRDRGCGIMQYRVGIDIHDVFP